MLDDPSADVPLDADALIAARDALLRTALDHFRSDPGVTAVFLAGSLAAGTADEWSDIDLRVVAEPGVHARFVAQRRVVPARWPGHLFNEWREGTEHCVSHFAPFGKIDVFYLRADTLAPSPWYTLPIDVLYDPYGTVCDLIERSAGLSFVVDPDEVSRSISRGLAAAHECVRRARRGELIYAQTLLDQLRAEIVRADDWLQKHTPRTALAERLDQRASANTLDALRASYVPCEAHAILRALGPLAKHYRTQVRALHDAMGLGRSLTTDMRALDVLRRIDGT